jgi:hypothetical protein
LADVKLVIDKLAADVTRDNVTLELLNELDQVSPGARRLEYAHHYP